MKSKFVVLLLFIFGIFYSSFAQIQPGEKQISAYNELNKKFNNSLRVDWNKKSGIPEIITFSKPVSYDKDKEKSAWLFLNDIKELIKFRTRIDTLVQVKNKERKGITHIRYQQKYGDVPVKGGEYIVTVLNDGKIQTAIGFFYNDITIDTKPKLTSEEAFKRAFNNPPKGYSLKDSLYSNELIIYPYKEEICLAYEIHIPGKRGGESWCYFINAFDGKVIESKSDVINSQANTYLRHPGLDASYTTINPLPNFYNNTALMGTYANVLNDESSRAYSASNDFRYSTGDTHFDEANLYYHVDRIAAYFNALGFNEFTQITAHAHTDFYEDLDKDGLVDDPSPNASYNTQDHHIRFSDGQGVAGYNSYAREDMIIYHEYTHAVTDFASGGLDYWDESGGIGYNTHFVLLKLLNLILV
jgi:Zn-dependent metalloprotease